VIRANYPLEIDGKSGGSDYKDYKDVDGFIIGVRSLPPPTAEQLPTFEIDSQNILDIITTTDPNYMCCPSSVTTSSPLTYSHTVVNEAWCDSNILSFVAGRGSQPSNVFRITTKINDANGPTINTSYHQVIDGRIYKREGSFTQPLTNAPSRVYV
jgi:hypothetical protein